MRKLFAVVLIIMLPAQALWAAVDACCQQGGGTPAHQGHQQKAQKADPKSGVGSSGGCFYTHCTLCHFCTAAATPVASELPLPAPASASDSAVEFHFPPIYLEGPERPNWLAAV